MKFAYIKTNGENLACVYFEDTDAYYNLNDLSLSQNNFSSMGDFIERHTDEDIKKISTLYKNNFSSINNFYKPSDIKILPPLLKAVHDVICVGLNYKEHLGEVEKGISNDSQIPEYPVFFTKRSERFIGPNDKIECSVYTEALDYEVELAVVIGKKAKDVKKENAEDTIFGYTIFNDISARDIQKRHNQWFKGKSLDTASAIGPYIVHKSSLPMPLELDVKSVINGEIRQNSNTKYLMFDIPTVIENITYGMTLLPCDIISTGSPSGVGMGFDPPKMLKKDDVVECSIEKIGTLKNTVL